MPDTSTNAYASGKSWGGPLVALGLCAVVVLAENFDLAVMGLTGPGIMRDLAISKSGFGLAVSATMFGFFLGAPSGGMLGDRYGRRNMLSVALVILGLSSLVAPHAPGLEGFALARFFTGYGVGMAFPNALAIATSVLGPHRRARAIAVTTAGGSVGGIAAGLVVAIGGGALPWQDMFYVGGAVTLALTPVVMLILPNESYRPAAAAPPATVAAKLLFGEGRALATLPLWVANFFTAATVHILLSWLPTMIRERGFDVSLTGVVNTALYSGGIVGGLLFGTFLDRVPPRRVFLLIYGGMTLSLALTVVMPGAAGSVVAAALTGIFIMGGQTTLYASPSIIYPPWGRAAGTGWAVGVGRWGAILGPSLVGFAYDAGAQGSRILLCAIPGLVVAGAAVVFALTRSGRLVQSETYPLPDAEPARA